MKRYLNGKLVKVTPEQEAEFTQRMDKAIQEEEQEKIEKQEKIQNIDSAIVKLQETANLTNDELKYLKQVLK